MFKRGYCEKCKIDLPNHNRKDVCPKCGEDSIINIHECENCGHEFRVRMDWIGDAYGDYCSRFCKREFHRKIMGGLK